MLISTGLLCEQASIFKAEAHAILEAAKTSLKKKGKIHYNNKLDILIRSPTKLKVMWTPGHTGIQGNEYADEAATVAHKTPLYPLPVHNPTKTQNFFHEIELARTET